MMSSLLVMTTDLSFLIPMALLITIGQPVHHPKFVAIDIWSIDIYRPWKISRRISTYAEEYWPSMLPLNLVVLE